jgi:hypothetical protein
LIEHYDRVAQIEGAKDAAFGRVKKFFQRNPHLTAGEHEPDEITKMIIEDIEKQREKTKEALRTCGWPI